MEDGRKPVRKPRTRVAKQAEAPAAAKPAVKASAAKASAQAATKPATRRKAVAARATRAVPPAADREARVRLAAYLRAERRGFAPGREWEDWLAAEAEIDAQSGGSAAPRGKSVSS